MVPNRTEVAAKIVEIKQDPTWSTIWEDLEKRVAEWLDEVECPEKEKQMIVDDLRSYV